MRSKLAVIVCAALMTAMLGACGGSTAASSGQAEAAPEAATTAEEEVLEPEAAPEAATTAEEEVLEPEAAPGATTTAEEALLETGAEETVAELNAGAGSFSSGTMFEGAITPSEATDNSNLAKLSGVDGQGALGAAPAVESLEGLDGEKATSINGKISLQGKTQEYTAFFIGQNNGIMGFSIIFADSKDVLTNYAEVYDFDKSAGYTRQDMLNLDVDQVYPGFTSMSCTDYTIVDAGSVYRLMLIWAELDNPDHVKETIDNGVFTSSNYHYPQLLAASGLKNSFIAEGCYQLTDDEIAKLHLIE